MPESLYDKYGRWQEGIWAREFLDKPLMATRCVQLDDSEKPCLKMILDEGQMERLPVHARFVCGQCDRSVWPGNSRLVRSRADYHANKRED